MINNKKFLSFLNNLLICLFLSSFLLVSCQNKDNYDECTSEPKTVLEEENVKLINLKKQDFIESGMLRKGEAIGFTFEAEAGDKIDFKTENDLCIWIYTPDNKIIQNTDLPITGRYTVQISIPKGTQKFEINLSLGNGQKFEWNKSDFPKYACGDSKPTDSNSYPVDFYPVKIPYDSYYLKIAKNEFCQDAFVKKDKKTSEPIIQVASFTDENKALDFAEFISDRIPTVTIGEPTTIYE